jgi:hypothetical protein
MKLGQLTGKDYSYPRRLAALLETHGFQDTNHEVMAVDREDVRVGFTADLARALFHFTRSTHPWRGAISLSRRRLGWERKQGWKRWRGKHIIEWISIL